MAAEEEAQEEGGGLMQSLARSLMVFMLVNALMKGFVKNDAGPSSELDLVGSDSLVHRNLWTEVVPLELRVYVSAFDEYNESATLVWFDDELWYDDGGCSKEQRLEFSTANLSDAWTERPVYAHAFLTRQDRRAGGELSASSALSFREAPAAEETGKRSLLAAGEAADAPSRYNNATTVEGNVTKWKPTLRIRVVTLPPELVPSQVPEKMRSSIDFGELTRKDSDSVVDLVYRPILFVDEFWLTAKQMVVVNDTVAALPLEASIARTSYFKWQLQQSLEQHWETQQQFGLARRGDNDMVRDILADTNPWLLAVTGVVSLLHVVFELLTVKSNVSYWRNKKDLVGLSFRTIATNCIMQLVILLYLLDNDTAWMIIVSNVVSLATELWKLTKAVKVVDRRLVFEEKYHASSTSHYDRIATSHLYYAAAPLAVGFSLYSLVTGTHKSWYSWLISSTVGFWFVFGFIAMTPQIYINYRLKSVAHLPWKAMVYKALNTFIDDLYAFVVKQPFLHRLACFRDDIIFIAMLYQRFIYTVDMSRTDDDGAAAKKENDDDDKQEGDAEQEDGPGSRCPSSPPSSFP